jgi:hypothetical protein
MSRLSLDMTKTSFRLTHGTNSLPLPPMPRPNWFGRNWKWVVPLGCLFARAFRGWVRPPGVLVCNRHNETIGCLQNRARPRASEPGGDRSDGSPISQTGIVSGNSNVTGPTGQASLSIPLSGPKGKATLYVEAMKSADIWVFQTMVVKIEKTGERIDLNKLPRQ